MLFFWFNLAASILYVEWNSASLFNTLFKLQKICNTTKCSSSHNNIPNIFFNWICVNENKKICFSQLYPKHVKSVLWFSRLVSTIEKDSLLV